MRGLMAYEHLGDADLDEIEVFAELAAPGPWYVRLLDDEAAMNVVTVSTIADDGIALRCPEFYHGEIVAATLIQRP